MGDGWVMGDGMGAIGQVMGRAMMTMSDGVTTMMGTMGGLMGGPGCPAR